MKYLKIIWLICCCCCCCYSCCNDKIRIASSDIPWHFLTQTWFHGKARSCMTKIATQKVKCILDQQNTNKQTNWQTDKKNLKTNRQQTNRQSDKNNLKTKTDKQKTDKLKNSQTDKLANKQTGKQTNWQTDKLANRRTGKHTKWQADKHKNEENKFRKIYNWRRFNTSLRQVFRFQTWFSKKYLTTERRMLYPWLFFRDCHSKLLMCTMLMLLLLLLLLLLMLLLLLQVWLKSQFNQVVQM